MGWFSKLKSVIKKIEKPLSKVLPPSVKKAWVQTRDTTVQGAIVGGVGTLTALGVPPGVSMALVGRVTDAINSPVKSVEYGSYDPTYSSQGANAPMYSSQGANAPMYSSQGANAPMYWGKNTPQGAVSNIPKNVGFSGKVDNNTMLIGGAFLAVIALIIAKK